MRPGPSTGTNRSSELEHVVIRKLEHLTGTGARPQVGFAVETRDRPGPAYKNGSFPDDTVWIQLHGGLIVAKAKILIGWVGEYSKIVEIRARTKEMPIARIDDFWARRAKFGYAAVAKLKDETWVEPFWAGPRTYNYEWVVLEDQKKRASWIEKRDPPRGDDDLPRKFKSWKTART